MEKKKKNNDSGQGKELYLSIMLKRNITCSRVLKHNSAFLCSKKFAFSSWTGKKPDRLIGKQVFWLIVKDVSLICAVQHEDNTR